MVGMAAMMLPSFDGAALDRVVPVVAALQLPPPVLVAPPSAASAQWTARSDTQNRPQRVSLTLAGASGQIVKRIDFNQRPTPDPIIGPCVDRKRDVTGKSVSVRVELGDRRIIKTQKTTHKTTQTTTRRVRQK